jgi:hypothetical protein
MINATESDGSKTADNRHIPQQGSEFGSSRFTEPLLLPNPNTVS